MAGIYLDTSALGRVLLAEPDATAIRIVLDQRHDWWASELLVVELRRFATRKNLMDPAETFLKEIDLLSVDPGTLRRTSRVEPSETRSLDAIHLDAAIHLKSRGRSDRFSPTTRQFQAGCRHHGLEIAAPSATR